MNILICEKCFENIARKHTNFARIWYDCCQACAEDKEMIFPMRLPAKKIVDDALIYLEQNGYLVSTECSRTGINVKLNGWQRVEVEEKIYDIFCLDHEHEEVEQ